MMAAGRDRVRLTARDMKTPDTVTTTTDPAGSGRNSSYRYCPVLAIVSIERPASVPCLPDTSVRM